MHVNVLTKTDEGKTQLNNEKKLKPGGKSIAKAFIGVACIIA